MPRGKSAWRWAMAAGAATMAASLAPALLAAAPAPSLQPGGKLDPATTKRGAEIYASVCSACHEQGLNRAPQRTMLSLMTPEAIDVALTSGVMQAQGSGLSAA